MDAGVARGHSIAGPARAAMPFTSPDTPLAYLFLPQKGTQGTKSIVKGVDHENTFHSGVDIRDRFHG